MRTTKKTLSHLLQLAGVSPSERQAAAWLREAVAGAQPNPRAVERPRPIDHNAPLVDIEKSARKLARQLERLRRKPFTRYAFWRSRVFGPVQKDRVEVPQVLATLEKIASAADAARIKRLGRPPATEKQHVVNSAFAFFVRFSPRKVSGTPTGAFATFARAFYGAATGRDPEDDGGLDRQIRQAQKRLPIERQRATKLRRKI